MHTELTIKGKAKLRGSLSDLNWDDTPSRAYLTWGGDVNYHKYILEAYLKHLKSTYNDLYPMLEDAA